MKVDIYTHEAIFKWNWLNQVWTVSFYRCLVLPCWIHDKDIHADKNPQTKQECAWGTEHLVLDPGVFPPEWCHSLWNNTHYNGREEMYQQVERNLVSR